MKPGERRCAMVIPGLLDLPATECKAALGALGGMSSLESLLSRARLEPFDGSGMESTLFELFHVSRSGQADWPVAALGYWADSRTATAGWCMRADPVHLIPDRDQLLLMGPEVLELSSQETHRLEQELNRFFAEDGWRIEALTPQRWYLHADEGHELETWHLSQVRGRSISSYLPGGGHGKQWQQNMNEVQMLLHNSEVNRERRSLNQLTISSLWFWGSGALPQTASSDWVAVWSNESVSTGLALMTTTADHPLPVNASDWLARAETGEHLLVIDDLQQRWFERSRQDSLSAWKDAVRSLQADWLEPLSQAVMQGDLQQLDLYSCDGRRFSVTRKDLKRWWRRRKSLLNYCA